MASEEYSNKLKKLKTKTKRSAKSRPKLGIILIIIILLGVLAIGYMFYDVNNAKKEEAINQLNSAKASGIESLNKMYGNTSSPNKELYIAEISNANSINEINSILNKANNDIVFVNYKKNTIKNIKDTYGKYYQYSPTAKELVNNIESAKSKEEINALLANSNIESDAKQYYLNDILNEIDDNNNYVIKIGGTTKRMTGIQLKQYLIKLSLAKIKEFKIDSVATTSKIAIVVNSVQCGKLPLKGDNLRIFDKSNVNISIGGEVLSSYVIANDISYSESKSIQNAVKDGSGDELSSSASSSITYSLGNINGILQATAAQKLNKKQIEEKFGEYGIRLNELSDKTQIFDNNVDYVLILSVSTEDIPKLINIAPNNIYVATAR